MTSEQMLIAVIVAVIWALVFLGIPLGMAVVNTGLKAKVKSKPERRENPVTETNSKFAQELLNIAEHVAGEEDHMAGSVALRLAAAYIEEISQVPIYPAMKTAAVAPAPPLQIEDM